MCPGLTQASPKSRNFVPSHHSPYCSDSRPSGRLF